MAERPKALVTAPFRGEGLEKLRRIADVVYDPWIEQQPLRIYNADQLAERIVELKIAPSISPMTVQRLLKKTNLSLT